MSMELIAIISATIALAGLILNGQRAQREETRTLRAETQAEFKAVRAEMQAQRAETQAQFQAQREEMQAQRTETQAQFKAVQEEFKTTRAEIGKLRERMAHLEGLVGGLSDALLSRRVAEEPAKYGTD